MILQLYKFPDPIITRSAEILKEIFSDRYFPFLPCNITKYNNIAQFVC